MSDAVWFAIIGGFVVNILGLAELRNVPKPKRPDFKDWLYWLPFVAWPGCGGLLVAAHEWDDAVQFSALLAFNVGLSAPLILRAMASVNPLRADPGQGA